MKTIYSQTYYFVQKLSSTQYLLILLFVLQSFVSFAHFGSKGPYGGTVSCSITKDTTVYLGSLNGGVFESTNSKLLAWRARPVGLKSGRITALAHTGTYLFAATADSGVFIFNGFLGSERYWKKANTGLGSLKISSLLAIDSITVLAGTESSGIYKTINKGVSWFAVNSSLQNMEIMAFAIAGSRIIHTSNGGVWASDNKGSSWFDFTDVLTHNLKTHAISYNTVRDEIVISNTNGLFVCANAGTSGSAVYVAAGAGLPANTNIRSISNDGTNWYIATDKGVFTSIAGTIHWTSVNAGLSNPDVNTITYFQNRLVAGINNEGVYKSSSTAISWVKNNIGFNNTKVFSMICSGSSVVIAATEKGVFVSEDIANIYKASNKGLTDSLHVNDLAFSQSDLLAATQNAGIFISSDTGKTWNDFNNGLGSLLITKLFTHGSEKYALASGGHLYHYDGANWQMDHMGIPSAAVPTSMVFSGNQIFIGLMGSGVYVKSISGTSWTSFNTGLSNLNVTSLTAFATKVFAGTDGSGVFVSDTASANWLSTSSTYIAHTGLMGLSAGRIQAMTNYGAYIFASYKGGLVASSDNGNTWIEAGNQFNLPSYTDVNKISFVTTRVFVSTENNGLYSNALSELPPASGIFENRDGDLQGFQLGPNPCRGEVFIDFKNIDAKVYEVVILDLTGRETDRLAIHKNTTSLKMNINNTPGIYFVQLITDKGSISKKLLVE